MEISFHLTNFSEWILGTRYSIKNIVFTSSNIIHGCI